MKEQCCHLVVNGRHLRIRLSSEMPYWRKWTLKKEGKLISIKRHIIERISLNYGLLWTDPLNPTKCRLLVLESQVVIGWEQRRVSLGFLKNNIVNSLFYICVGSQVNFTTGVSSVISDTILHDQDRPPGFLLLIAQAAWTQKPFKRKILQLFSISDFFGEKGHHAASGGTSSRSHLRLSPSELEALSCVKKLASQNIWIRETFTCEHWHVWTLIHRS